MEFSLSKQQQEVVRLPLEGSTFLEGPAGSGKTRVGVLRMLHLMESGVPGDEILVLTPQRTLASAYQQALQTPQVHINGGLPSLLTLGGLARRMVDLFWPLVASTAGFAQPENEPVFLTLETAQYYMAHLLAPRLEQGLFSSVRIEPNRMYSQVLDNLNKAALVGFSHSEIGQRLSAAWVGEPGQVHVYQDVQTSVDVFRAFCLQHNLLDFSLQVEIFSKLIWQDRLCRDYLMRSYRHLIYDNLEEDTPVAHDLLLEWLPYFQTSLCIYDWHGGFRTFLGADAQSAYRLKKLCSRKRSFEHTWPPSAGVRALGKMLSGALADDETQKEGFSLADFSAETAQDLALSFSYERYYPQMLDWVAQTAASLVHESKIPPQEIVILAPYMGDALRFNLVNRLESLQVPVRSHRPSRSLRDEPAARSLLTLSALAYPDWQLAPPKADVAYALMQAVKGLDLVRARLLSEIVYSSKRATPALTSFDVIKPEMQERITYRLGERFENLRAWLSDAGAQEQEFDYFLARLFGEVLSQPGYGFHDDFDAAQVTANLIESVQKFRWVAGETLGQEGIPLGMEYLAMVQQGVIAAQYVGAWQGEDTPAVLVAPAYTFLMANRPVQVQFWLDIGSQGWVERLAQPLTHPYVLARGWKPGRRWTDKDEVLANRRTLFRMAVGLLRRCGSRVYLGMSEMGEQGYEQRGDFLRAFQRALVSWRGEGGAWQ